MPTHYDDDSHVVEQRIQLLQGAVLGVSNGEAQIQNCILFWSKEDEVQNKGHIHGNLACDVGSNSFLGVHVHHNVGSQEGGAYLDDRSKA
jgi:hypothetical protein